MGDFLKQQYRVQQNLWDVKTNTGTNMTAVNNKTGEVFNGTTSAFNAIFSTPPDFNEDNQFVKAKTNGIATIVKMTQAEYDALAVKDANTLYVIVAA